LGFVVVVDFDDAGEDGDDEPPAATTAAATAAALLAARPAPMDVKKASNGAGDDPSEGEARLAVVVLAVDIFWESLIFLLHVPRASCLGWCFVQCPAAG
jgi:hypothetical protein